MAWLARLWARTGIFTLALLPLAGLFSLLAGMRRLAYRRGWLASVAMGVQVVVIGNITAGGSGKTPLTIWLVEHLRRRGLRPGVVSRGYGGRARGCVEVGPASDATMVGDEPLLVQRRTGVPVVVGRDRVAAVRTLLARHPGIDVVLSDDGLQHYRLRRDIELAVVDASGGLGNGWPLPAGPLREPARRLRTVDAVVRVMRGGPEGRPLEVASWRVDTRPGHAWRLLAPNEPCALSDLPRHDWLAVAGIGRPQAFFDMLARAGLRFSPRAYPDHHAFQPGELPAGHPVLMTEKDAVKCFAFAGTDWWAVSLDVAPEEGFAGWLGTRIPTTPRSGAHNERKGYVG